MPRRFISPRSEVRRPQHGFQPLEVSEDPDQLCRLAALVANGEVPLPDNLTPAARQQLVIEVGRRRRVRLIGFIAQAIAEDIHRSRAP